MSCCQNSQDKNDELTRVKARMNSLHYTLDKEISAIKSRLEKLEQGRKQNTKFKPGDKVKIDDVPPSRRGVVRSLEEDGIKIVITRSLTSESEPGEILHMPYSFIDRVTKAFFV